mmetsp:Transcript_94686/g.247096  ORF Transcript_94686/g.247096 Transcript_94686/m.247096 type:complete len:499 (-) Transcript_94686:492-1988(-)
MPDEGDNARDRAANGEGIHDEGNCDNSADRHSLGGIEHLAEIRVLLLKVLGDRLLDPVLECLLELSSSSWALFLLPLLQHTCFRFPRRLLSYLRRSLGAVLRGLRLALGSDGLGASLLLGGRGVAVAIALRGLLLLVLNCVAGLLAQEEQERLEQLIQQEAAPNRARYCNDWAADQNQPRHLSREVLRDETVQHEEVETVVALPATDNATQQCVVEREVQVARVHAGARRLVLGHGIHQGVAGLGVLDEEAADTGGKRAKVPSGVQQHTNDQDASDQDTHGLDPEADELPRIHLLIPPDHVAEPKDLVAKTDQSRSQLLQAPNRLPTDDRDLNGPSSSDDPEQGVGLVDTSAEAAEHDKHKRMDAYHVQHKNRATAPSCCRVGVRGAREHAIRPRGGCSDRAQPQPEGANDGGDGHGLVVELAADGAHEVRRDDCHDANRHQAGVHAARNLVGQQAREQGGDGSKPRRDHAADVVDTHRNVVENIRHRGDERETQRVG